MPLSEREKRIRQRLRDDFPHYAPRCLKIRTKSGATAALTFNRAQAYVHERLEEQRARTGKVRALILKARQQGFSTYIGGRFYHRTTNRHGVRTFILTHEQTATDTLFEMVERFHANCPPLVKPKTGKSNAKELSFSRLDAGYEVGTAGTKAVGRSKALTLFHGSEVAFWPNAAGHFAGAIQGVPDMPGTEIILESTANGVGGEFHARWQQAEAGIGDYIAIFVPWFWTEEYRRAVPAGFELDDDEATYAERFGLDLEQMAWRRNKIAELKEPALFKQEYPATAAEAFTNTGHDSFIKTDDVLAARKATCEATGPLVIGADPARFGDDRFSLAWRRGRKLLKIESKGGKVKTADGEKQMPGVDSVTGANWIKQVIDADKPKRVFVDVGGVGAATVDILRQWGAPYDEIVVPINFGGEPQEPETLLPDGSKLPGPRNRRAEMWSRSRDWLKEPGGADIPDSDALHADACAPGYKYDLKQRLLLEAKEHMRSRGVRSPDEWDAVALTFAEPVPAEDEKRNSDAGHYGEGSWMGA